MWIPTDGGIKPVKGQPGYVHRHTQRGLDRDPATRPFIAWDGEGVTHPGERQQSYVLFGCSTHDYIVDRSLTTSECLDLILSVEKKYPNAFHIAFAFDYDVNMILRNLTREQLKKLRYSNDNSVWFGKYRIKYIPRKFFVVTKVVNGVKMSATIYDIFTFYAKSFKSVCEKYLPDDYDQIVTAGKEVRGKEGIWQWEEMDNLIIPYWKAEIILMAKLADNLRTLLTSQGIILSQWHGPGAVASYLLNQHKVQEDMTRGLPDAVIDASAHAYAGGHFELFKMGHYMGPIYSYDINSAYPYALSKVPSLSGGEWEHLTEFDRAVPFSENEDHFAVYHVRRAAGGTDFENAIKQAQPLFYRDHTGNMHYPLVVDGWYWSPEARLVWDDPDTEFLEGYVFHPAKDVKPFAWVVEVYNRRKKLKAEGNPAELALKLGINSLYGKLAQRIGWDREKHTAPRWHQLEWAGWLTSYARAMLYTAIVNASNDGSLLAVETDGIYTTALVDGLDLGKEWGQWKPDIYDGITYVQNGVYWYLKDGQWLHKYRGLDPESISHDRILSWMHDPLTIGCDECKKPRQKEENHTCRYVAQTKRFRGFGLALTRTEGLDSWRVWEKEDRFIAPGGAGGGKRKHDTRRCAACQAGMKFSEGLHDLVITKPQGGISTAHNLPWREQKYITNEEAADEWQAFYRWGAILDEKSFHNADMQSRIYDAK